MVLKLSIRFKVKADWDDQPQEYREYFEDWMCQSKIEVGFEGMY